MAAGKKARLDRRQFLQRTGRAGLGAAALLMGCPADPEPMLRTDGGQGDMDRMLRDLGRDLADMGLDGSHLDAADLAQTLGFSRPPFTQLVGDSGLRLRFETFEATPLAVRVEPVEGGMGRELVPRVSPFEQKYEWPGPTINIPHRDIPGTYHLQTADFADLQPGRRYRWLVDMGDGQERTGHFWFQPPRERTLRLGWAADTSFPVKETIGQRLAEHDLDLILHGGDVQYFTSPFDTWSGFSHAFAPATATAPMQVVVGNHEYEMFEEYDIQFLRLFGGQGGVGGDVQGGYYGVTLGGVRIIVLNSERDFADPDTAQHRFLMAELDRVARDPGLRFPIVAFHRPLYSFGRIPDRRRREFLHPIFRDHDVPLVLAGHEHNYQRFLEEGVHYVVDGGAGALLMSPDDDRDVVERDHPQDIPLRQSAFRGFGYTIFEIAPDDSIRLLHYDEEGAVLEDLTLA